MTSQNMNMAFELHCRLSTLKVHTVNEISLINLERGKQLLHTDNRGAVHAKFDREIELALSWEQYLRRQIAKEFGSLPESVDERPVGACLPRCRRRWTYQLSNSLEINDDKFLKLLAEFFVEMMVSSLVGSMLDMQEVKERFLEEWQRIRPLQSGEEQTKTKQGGEVVARAPVKKPAPPRTRR